MLNLTLIRLCLRQYGLVWLAAFALVVASALIAWKLAEIDYIRAADLLLTGALLRLKLFCLCLFSWISMSLVAPRTLLREEARSGDQERRAG